MSEERIEVETEEVEAVAETEDTSEEQRPEAEAEADSELDSYSKGVQQRIKKLTEKYRKEERDREEAVRMAQQLLEENKQLKSRVQKLDSGYLSEYGSRLTTQLAAAKQAYKAAYDAGDSEALAEAQIQLTKLTNEQQRYSTAKAQFERQQAKPAPQPAPQQVQAQPQRQAQPDPKAQSWAERNKWFGEDRVMTTGAFAIHQTLIEDEGFDPQSDEYYSELDRRLRKEFPHKFTEKKSGGGSQVASAVSSASRSTKPGRRTVKLTPSQVAIAKKLNVPLEEYAKYVKE